MVNDANHESQDSKQLNDVIFRDYCINFHHNTCYLAEGYERLIEYFDTEKEDTDSNKLISLNISLSQDLNKPFILVIEYHYKKGRDKERFLRQSVFNIINIQIQNWNCYIFELVSLGQIILRRTKYTKDKNELPKALY